jgi:hypothetical protein
MKNALILSLIFASSSSFACSHHFAMSAPELHQTEAIIAALKHSQGKQPKPFNLNEFKAVVNEHKHDHIQHLAKSTLTKKSAMH